MARHNLYLRNACIPERGGVNLLVVDGIITEISAEELSAPGDANVIDAGGGLLCPGLVDGHLHLDKTLIGLPWMPHTAGPTRLDRIQNDKSVLPSLPLSVEVRAANLVRLAISKGTTHMRSHVNVTNEAGLGSLHDVMKVREQFAGLMDVQIVAFPQNGVVSNPGTIELLEAAIGEGAELLGGIDPANIDRDPVGQLDALFALAERTGAGIDIHLHEPGELGNFNVVLICERAKAHGMTGKVTVSHGFALGAISDATFEQTAALMAEAGVSVSTFGPGSSPMLPLKKLAAAGVTVFAGSDSIRSTWWRTATPTWLRGRNTSLTGSAIDATTISNRRSTLRPTRQPMCWALRITGWNPAAALISWPCQRSPWPRRSSIRSRVRWSSRMAGCWRGTASLKTELAEDSWASV